MLDGPRARRVRLGAVVTTLVLAVAAGSSSARPDPEAFAQRAPEGLGVMAAGLDPAMLALARRHDPASGPSRLTGLTPGWESLTLAGRPTLDSTVSGIEALRANAAMTDNPGALRPARPFVFDAVAAEDRRRALRCLTQAIYYEAALESDAGQAGVAQVVLNRVRDRNFPNTVCGVVFQGAERTTGCQFSFTCDGSMALAPAEWAWRRAGAVAERALNGHVAESVGTATHYHADYVRPWWAPTVTRIVQIGAHIFYRWNGALGDTAAFVQAHAGREPVIDEARFARPRVQHAVLTAPSETLTGVPGGAVRTVELDGHTRVVGVVSLGGRRQPTRDEVAAINERLRAYEQAEAAPAAPPPEPPPGVTPMDVEEVGRPGA